MNTKHKRLDGRDFDHVRKIKVSYNPFGYADSSVLFELGDTKIFCAISIQNGVPFFLKGKGVGWLTAEYSLMPTSTLNRTLRESSTGKKNGRSVEISRMIGRSLRTIVDLNQLGEKTIYIDCDVLQADGGTRVASITGSFLALKSFVDKWLKLGLISKNILSDSIAAISAGMIKDQIYLDLNCEEDNKADADFNFVLTGSGKIIEISGTAEKYPVTSENFEKMKLLATNGIMDIINKYAKKGEIKTGFTLSDLINKK